MKRFMIAAGLALSVAGFGTAALAAPSAQSVITASTQSLVHKAYVVIPTCGVGIVGFNVWGAPIYGRVCD